MIVYVVTSTNNNFGNTTVHGVYSSRELAEKELKIINMDSNRNGDSFYGEISDCLLDEI